MAKKSKNSGRKAAKSSPDGSGGASFIPKAGYSANNRKSCSPAKERRFILETLLGVGGICEVYSALDLRRVEWGDANPRVAVKRLRPDLADNPQARLLLAQEYYVLRHLAHPGVVRVFDLHKEPFGVCFSMELLEGRTAHAMLGEHPNGLGGMAASPGFALFDVLAFLHGKGVVHGDVKPSNIFVTLEGRIALLDFNTATVTPRHGAACSPITQGLRENLRLPSYSLCYASPQRLQGGTPSMADDIYAACCAFYEIASGVHPFGKRSSHEAMENGIPLQRPPGLTFPQWTLLRRGLSFDAGLRPNPENFREVFADKGPLSGLTQLVAILPFFNKGDSHAVA
ncbi:MAG: serine/threonine protein kinase [Desulfovibrio sp.]|jgi:serine/threonine-protein kinase Stk1|nr:serine/threonine protein kinase [Desulfovibrio sp.]